MCAQRYLIICTCIHASTRTHRHPMHIQYIYACMHTPTHTHTHTHAHACLQTHFNVRIQLIQSIFMTTDILNCTITSFEALYVGVCNTRTYMYAIHVSSLQTNASFHHACRYLRSIDWRCHWRLTVPWFCVYLCFISSTHPGPHV